MENETYFGFEKVAASDKARRVGEVFSSVASRYDLMNDAMSFGLHRLWKRSYIDGYVTRAGMKLLDLAGGTGDIAFLLRKSAHTPEVTVCDINHAMLFEGKKRSIDSNQLAGLEWVTGNAESLPFPDNRFDGCTIAFGIRNVTDIPKALRDIHRVLKPGSQFRCLEFSPINKEPLKSVYDAYSFHLIPLMGQLLTKDRAAYQYLVESIRQFPSAPKFELMLRDAGFARTSYRKMSGGVVAVHSGWKL